MLKLDKIIQLMTCKFLTKGTDRNLPFPEN